MILTWNMLLAVFVGVMIITAGCSTVKQGSPPVENGKDPIVGLWISEETGSVTYFRFYGNGTFDAWSNIGDIHPKYSYQYFGEWRALGSHEYATSGQHIGYGEVTALAIWRDLTIRYDPRSDTFLIPVYNDQVFSRIAAVPEKQPV